MPRMPVSIYRQPLSHFLLLGALLYGAVQQLSALGLMPVAAVAPITVTATDVERLRRQWLALWAREPTAKEMQNLLRRYADDEILLREALRLQLDRRDKVARERQIRNLRFAFPDSTASDESLLRTAAQLGMAERDPVVRHRLVQAMEHRIADHININDAEMRDYLRRHEARYAAAQRYQFSQLFFNADAPGDAMLRAQNALSRIRAGFKPTPADPFLLGTDFRNLDQQDITLKLGPAIAAAVRTTAEGQWSEPVRSAYGLHLIYLEQRLPAAADDFQALRQRLAYAVLEEKSQSAVRAALPALRRRYRVDALAFAGPLP